jgi:endonuclease/exonuclease/phosphatase family metal-dependent hydrolase
MRAHARPTFAYNVDVPAELQRLDNHRQLADRAIPAKANDNVIIATWNLTNFGLQEREEDHLRIMADILRPFDLVAVQEVADNLDHLDELMDYLGDEWDYWYTDVGGNQERLAYLYDAERVLPTGLAAELAMRQHERLRVTVDDVEVEGGFPGFNRNPYMLGFTAGDFEFFLVNVHLYWSNFSLRQLETEGLARWAARRVGRQFPPNNDIILIGDFNMPRVDPSDDIFALLTQNGLQVPKHTTNLVGTNLAGDADYDEIAFFPGRTADDFTGAMGVFDFDNAVFPNLFQANETHFFQYVRYYIADHRPMWAEFRR